jgi:protein CWC15
LKLRRPGQGAPAELRAKDLKSDLEARERRHFESKGGSTRSAEEDETASRPPRLLEYRRREEEGEKNIDADDSDSSEDEDDSDDSDADSDEDDTAELMRELEKIKKEREEERRKQEEERERMEAERKDEEVKFGNPLLASQKGEGDFNVKKRWYEDVVFKNQAKDEPQKKKRFINDTIRNDFHKKFLSKYIQ